MDWLKIGSALVPAGDDHFSLSTRQACNRKLTQGKHERLGGLHSTDGCCDFICHPVDRAGLAIFFRPGPDLRAT